MACSKPSGVSSLMILLVMATVAEPGVALKLEPAGTSKHFPPLLDCGPGGKGKRHHIPHQCAVSPRRDPLRGRGRANGAGPDLSAAAEDVAAWCGVAIRHAGAWRTGCLVSYAYADTDRPTAREGAFRGWFYHDSDDAALGSQCTAAEYAWCLNESAQVVPALKDGGQLSMVHGDTVVVVGYAYYLRVSLISPTPRSEDHFFQFLGIFDMVALVLIKVARRGALVHQESLKRMW
ncbi:unnamed protein product [Urochloa humidicola]